MMQCAVMCLMKEVQDGKCRPTKCKHSHIQLSVRLQTHQWILVHFHESFSVKPLQECVSAAEVNNQKALKLIWQRLLKSSASQTVVKRHCLCGGSASWSPASKLTQALYPLKERHLYRTVTSGRLGAKKAPSVWTPFNGNFQVCGGNSSITDFCYSVEVDVFHKISTANKRKNIGTIYENDPSCKVAHWKSDLQEFPLNTLETGLTVKEYYLPGKAR